MKRMCVHTVTLFAAFAMAVLLSACSNPLTNVGGDSSGSGRELALQEQFGDCVLVNFPDDTGADDYGKRREVFYADLEKALRDRAERICIRNSLPLELMELYQLDHGIFWVKSVAATSPTWLKLGDDEETTSYQLYEIEYYDLSSAEIDEMKREIDDAADQILARVPTEADDWTTAKIIHDELCKLVEYDDTLEKPHTHDLYGTLVNHEAVCSGYSIAFNYLMNKRGLYNRLSYSDNHAWNYVSSTSYDHYIDATWDDTDLYDRTGSPYIFYDYFFLNRDEVTSIDSHAIVSGDPYTTQANESDPYNYHAHEGYLAESYDLDAISEMFRRQYDVGSNLLTVRFANDDDYQTALSWADGSADIYTLLGNVGYEGSYYFWSNDNVNVINIGLYPPE